MTLTDNDMRLGNPSSTLLPRSGMRKEAAKGECNAETVLPRALQHGLPLR